MSLKLRPPGTNILGAFSFGLKDGPDLGDEYAPNSSYHLPSYSVTLKDLAYLGAGQSNGAGQNTGAGENVGASSNNAAGPNNAAGLNIDSIAKEVAWQCVALCKNGSVVVGEVTPRSQAPRPAGHAFDGPVRMTSLSQGPIIDGIYKNATDLAKIKEELGQKYGLNDEYEPRMLKIPGLLVTAIWLKSQAAGGADWVVPLHTKNGDLQKEPLVTMEKFLEITQSLAKDRLASPIFD
jgi:hypothetical protein